MADDRGEDEITARRAAGGRTASLDHGELAPSSGAHAAGAVPDSLNIRVDLPPAPRPEMPEDEVAVAIDDVAVNPGTVVGRGPGTTSVEVITPGLAVAATVAPCGETRRRTVPCSPPTHRGSDANA